VGALLRFAYLDQAQLFRDEAASWLLSSYPVGSLLQHNLDKTYPPLYGLLLRGWMLLFGTGEAALRSPSAIPGVVTLIVAWRWTHQALGRTAGLMAAAVLAVSALLVGNSREARMYALETAFATTAWWLAWRLASGAARRTEKSDSREILIAVLLVLAVAGEVWTMAFGLPAAGLQLLFALICLVAGRRARTGATAQGRGPALAVVAIGVGAASLALWLPSLLAVPLSAQPFWTPRPDLASLVDTLLSFVGATGQIDLSAPAPIVAVVLAIVGLVALAMPRRLGPVGGRRGGPTGAATDSTPAALEGEAQRLRLFGLAALLGTSLVVVIWLYSQVEPVYDARYLGAAAAPLAALIAAGFVAVVRAFRRHPLASRLVAASLAVAVLGPMTSASLTLVDRLDANSGTDPARQTAQRLLSVVRPGDVVLALDAQTYFPIDYYLGQTAAGSQIDRQLYDWDANNEPFYLGTSLIQSSRVIDEPLIARLGWQAALPALRPGGTIWLVTITNGDDANLGFDPLAGGTLVQQSTVFVPSSPAQSRDGQIRALLVPGTAVKP
jgi:hypothetical protein